MEDLWISLEPVDTRPAQWTLMLEAFELLDLLVRVDPHVGWELIFQCSDFGWTFELNEKALFRRDRVRPRFALDSIDSAEVEADPVTTFNALQRMLGFEIDSWPPPSSGFARVKQELLGAWASMHGGRVFDRAREGRIEVMPRFSFTTDLDHDTVKWMVSRMSVLARDTQVLLPDARRRTHPLNPSSQVLTESIEEQVARQRRAVFCFVTMNVEFLFHRLTDYALGTVYNMMATLPVRELLLDQAMMSELRPWRVVNFLSRAFRGTGCGVTKFELSSGCFDLGIVTGVCSALIDSTSVSTFAFTRSPSDADPNDDRPDRSVWWPWLAFALFSADARHSIRTVELDVEDFTMADLVAMQEVVRHHNPLALVCGQTEASIEAVAHAASFAPQTHFAVGHHILDNTESPRQVAFGPGAEYHFHRIVQDRADQDYVEILIEGAGVCWADRAVLREVRPLDRSAPSAITDLRLQSIPADGRSAVLGLLRLVGESLESLTLDGLTSPFDDTFMGTVCESCPRLKRLYVEGELASVGWLTRWSSPRCTLEQLEITKIVDLASVLELLAALAAGAKGVAKSLRYLQLNAAEGDQLSEAQHRELCEAWLQMLRENTRLEMCHLEMPEGFLGEGVFLDRVQSYARKPIFGPQKLALLSALAPPMQLLRNSEEPVSEHFQLPREVVEQILVTAGIASTRVCF